MKNNNCAMTNDKFIHLNPGIPKRDVVPSGLYVLESFLRTNWDKDYNYLLSCLVEK
jgi:hypothetical protein